jgi:hypothetical protein
MSLVFKGWVDFFLVSWPTTGTPASALDTGMAGEDPAYTVSTYLFEFLE